LSGGGLISDDDYLVSSDSDGRVAVLNAGGVLPENFDKYSERDALEFLGISPKEYQLIKEIKKQK